MWPRRSSPNAEGLLLPDSQICEPGVQYHLIEWLYFREDDSHSQLGTRVSDPGERGEARAVVNDPNSYLGTDRPQVGAVHVASKNTQVRRFGSRLRG